MPGRVVATGVYKSFPTPAGPLPVIEAMDLTVADGEFVTLVGPSGCGKSTFLDILAGFERPDRGSVTVDGEPVTGPIRSQVLIPQHSSVFPWQSARRNITFVLQGMPSVDQKRTTLEYLRMVGLESFQTAFPHQLSGGMLKRLELARALAVKPDVLYMDEPFGALDALTRAHLQDSVMEIHARLGNTVMMITHDVDEAVLLSDRVVMMTNGPAATIGEILSISLPRPRRRLELATDPEYARCRAAVLEFLYARHRVPARAA